MTDLNISGRPVSAEDSIAPMRLPLHAVNGHRERLGLSRSRSGRELRHRPPQHSDADTEALTLLQQNPTEFIAACGDQYVSHRTLGWYVRAIYQFQGLAESERRTLESSIGLAGSGGRRARALTVAQRGDIEIPGEALADADGRDLRESRMSVDQLIAYAQQFGGYVPDGGSGSEPPEISCASASVTGIDTTNYYSATNYPSESFIRMSSLRTLRSTRFAANVLSVQQWETTSSGAR